MKKNSKQLLFERMNTIGGMPINEGVGDELSKKGQIIRASELKQGSVFERREQYQGVIRFVAMERPKQSSAYKNEYVVNSTVLDAPKSDFFKRGMEYPVRFIIKYGQLGQVNYLGEYMTLRKQYPDL
jgi:hypothetical protein